LGQWGWVFAGSYFIFRALVRCARLCARGHLQRAFFHFAFASICLVTISCDDNILTWLLQSTLESCPSSKAKQEAMQRKLDD
jgi:hypothetical protein